MKRLLAFLEYALFGLCVLVVVLALGVVVADRTGLLRDALAGRIARELGIDRARVGLAQARLHWSDPGMRLEGLRIDGLREGEETLRVDSLGLRLGLFPPRLAGIDVGGARLVVGRDGLDLIERWQATRGPRDERPGEIDWSETPFPELELADVRLAVDSRDLFAVEPAWRGEVCRLSVAAIPRSDGRPWIGGALTPVARDGAELAPIRFSGTVNERGRVSVQASSTDLALDVNALPEFIARGLDPLGPWRAAADVELLARFAGLDPVPIEADLRLRVDGFSAIGPPDPLHPTDVTLVARAGLDRDPTDGRPRVALEAELDGRWRDTPVDVDLRAGRAAPSDASIAVGVHVPALPLDATTYELADRVLTEQLGLESTARLTGYVVEALDVEGAAEVRLDFRRDRRPLPDGRMRDRTTLAAIPDPATLLRYRGWPARRERPVGFPVPVALDRGQMVIAVDSAAERVVQVGFTGMGGSHDSGDALFEGLIQSLPLGPEGLGEPPDLRLALDVPSMDVDGGVRVGLEGLNLGYDVAREFEPRGGTLAGRLDLVQTAADAYPRIALDLDLADVDARWAGLPVPLTGVDGEVDLRFSRTTVAGLPDPADAEARAPLRRAFGVRVAVAGRGPEEATVEVRAGLRDPELALLGGVERHPEGTWPQLRAVEVDVGDAVLTDASRAALEGLETVARVLERVRPQGALEARVRNQVWARDAPSRTALALEPDGLDLVVVPIGLELTDLRGSLRTVRRSTPERTDDGEVDELEFDVRMGARTAGLGDLRVDAARRPGAGGSDPITRLSIALAGLAPLDPSWPDRLRAIDAEQLLEPLEQLRALRPGGRVDLDLDQRLDDGLAPLGEPAIQVHLRRNDLAAGPLGRVELNGSLSTDGRVVQVPLLVARVADQPVRLAGLRVLPRERLVELAPRTRALLDRALPGGGAEWIVVADVELLDARLDDRLVARIRGLDPTPDGEPWQLLLDAEDATVLAALPPDRPPVFAAAGRLRPHDARFPPNLRLASAELDLAHAVVDGRSVRALGEVRRAFGEASGLGIEDASAIVSYVGGRLTLDGLQASFAGGRVASPDSLGAERLSGGRAASIELSEPYRFDLALDFDGVDVNQILSQIVTGDGTDAGRLRGDLRLVGEPNDPLSLEGTGFVALENARLYSIPVVRALFKQLGFDATATFDWMRTRLSVRDGQLVMTDAVAHSPLLKLVGGGTLGLDGRLDHDFDLTYSLVDRLGFFSRLVYWFQSRLLRIAVRGDMARPRVLLTNPILDLFGFSRQRPPRLPYPRIPDLPERF